MSDRRRKREPEYTKPVRYPDPGSLAHAQGIKYETAFKRWWADVQNESRREKRWNFGDDDEE